MRRFGVRRVLWRMIEDAWWVWTILAIGGFIVFAPKLERWYNEQAPVWFRDATYWLGVGALWLFCASGFVLILVSWYGAAVHNLEQDEGRERIAEAARKKFERSGG